MNSTMKCVAGALVLAWTLDPAAAMDRGTTESGRPYISGGVDAEEIATLNSVKSQYALSILTAAKGSGAYLADVHVRITDAQAREVLNAVMDGPFLLVDLPAGRYQVEAVLGDKVHKNSVTVGAGGSRQTAFYFDTHDEVEAANPTPSTTP